MKILIVGDSFAADNRGWPGMIGGRVVNKAQNGVGEYKILKQLSNTHEFDKIIVCHTSPWRVHTRYHPVHSSSIDRPFNDFILSDLEHHSKKNKEIELIYKYMSNYIDYGYQKFIYNSIVKEIKQIPNTVHLTFHDKMDTLVIDDNLNEIWKDNKGDVNHMSMKGNQAVAEHIKKKL